MKTPFCVLACLGSALASAQTVTSVYNRDTHEPFRLKAVKVESTVIGPIVRTSAWLTYANPYTKPTEATLNFDLPDAAALSGFAYRYGDEYVPGRLLDKDKAWSIYTAITSRNRDPGIMEQWSPTDYHCQIFPVKKGYDLRIRLWTIGMVGPNGALPKPLVPNAVSYYKTDDATLAKPEWKARSVGSGPVRRKDGGLFVDETAPVVAVAQRFKDGRTYVTGLVRPPVADAPKPEVAPSITAPVLKGLRQPKTIRLDGGAYAFCGWVPRNRALSLTSGGKTTAVHPRAIPAGADAARLWAQQMLAKGTWQGSRDVLAFSLKYGVPSNATALLAVPRAEMARYRAKEKEYRRAEAEARRRELENARQSRAWTPNRAQNWSSSGGGDPEIRVTIPHALRVEAILPDRRVVELKADGDVWGGNFEIPATAPEGTYRVRILAYMEDGTTTERSWTYEVDRTPPKGRASFANDVVTVESEPGLPEVTAYGRDGRPWVLVEVSPGTYRGAAPSDATVVLKDRAGNKGEAAWSSLP